ncbi:Hypothetical predicted protein [Lecanosticta acicola]|uniref:2EXR domain-containing protein n=1 Tax=Lecanosticta acicola TaxID=111012 RepID=A0AAI8Z3E2_9PEZI|nr:Hypothetical predicted protein [Lecanosticta acicola]
MSDPESELMAAPQEHDPHNRSSSTALPRDAGLAVTQERTNFFTLPPELRDRIYEMVIADATSASWSCSDACSAIADATDSDMSLEYECPSQGGDCILLYTGVCCRIRGNERPWEHQSDCQKPGNIRNRPQTNYKLCVRAPAALHVCRKMRQETMAMFYGGRVFHVITSNPWKSWIKDWLKLIGPERASMIRKVYLDYDGSAMENYLREANCRRYRKSQKRGERFKPSWGKKALLATIGLMGLGVAAESFQIGRFDESDMPHTFPSS